MENFPPLPAIEEDLPLSLNGPEPFQYSLESDMPGAESDGTSSELPPLSPDIETSESPGYQLPDLEPRFPIEGDFPAQEIGPIQENEYTFPTEEPTLSPSSESDSRGPETLQDIHSELKELVRHLKGQKPPSESFKQAGQLSQKFSYRLP